MNILDWLKTIFTSPIVIVFTIAALGSICGSMTSTPALGALISVSKTDSVALAYAATYPVGLIVKVLCCQFLPILFG